MLSAMVALSIEDTPSGSKSSMHDLDTLTAVCLHLNMHDLPLDMLTTVCLHLDIPDLVRFAAACKRFRVGDPGLETVELQKSPVVMALWERAFPRSELVQFTRPTGCSESWIAYLARCARQHRCREAPPIAAGYQRALFVDATGLLMAAGRSAGLIHLDADGACSTLTPVAAMAGVRVRSVATGNAHSLALSWDGRVSSWGDNHADQLDEEDTLVSLSPTSVEGLEGVRGISSSYAHNVAVMRAGDVIEWTDSSAHPSETGAFPRLGTVNGFEGVQVRHVCAHSHLDMAIGEGGELFSWGFGDLGTLGHGDRWSLPWPKRVEGLRGVRVSCVAIGMYHALALTEEGMVYAWGENKERATLGNLHVETQLLPKPVEALRGVRVGSVAAAGGRSYALADTGELWAWGRDSDGDDVAPLGHGEEMNCPADRVITWHQVGCGGRRQSSHSGAGGRRKGVRVGQRVGSRRCARRGHCGWRGGEAEAVHAADHAGAARRAWPVIYVR
jgi:hypothetical protein